jgi:AcrR family transcriptional regulator
MPRQVDGESRDRDIRAATLRVIASHGVSGVTIRKVASELGASTTVITHFTRDKDELLRRAVGAELEERRRRVAEIAATADDPFWPALVSAAAANVVPAISELVRAFDRWWTSLVARLVSDRLVEGLSKRDAADAIGIVAEGLLLPLDAANWSAARRRRLARTLIIPLLRR